MTAATMLDDVTEPRRRSDAKLPPRDDILELLALGESRDAVAARFGVKRNAVSKALRPPLADLPGDDTGTRCCNACGQVKALDLFGRDRKGPGGRNRVCAPCTRERKGQRTRTRGEDRVIRNRAMNRAVARLKEAYRDEYDAMYAEELRRVKDEVRELNAAAAAQAVAGHEGHPAVVLLRSGSVPIGETREDRIRADVGGCPVCIGSHDRGHVCPECGAGGDDAPEAAVEPEPLTLAVFPAILPDGVRAAALAVCAHALDADDARAQMEALGLISDSEDVPS